LTHLEIPRNEVSDQYQGGWNQIVGRLEQYIGKKSKK
jgi:hypothetical protein